MFKDQAIVLIRFIESSQRYEVTPEASAMLASIKTPLAIVSVAGMYRTGKSYLLNRMLLNRSNGFGVGPTINPCTKGLWIWGQPIRSQDQNGKPLTLLIIDTEGLGALDEDQTHDVKIFSLAILLSTCFVYNSVGSIDENAIQSLNMVLNLTEHISKLSQSSPNSPSELPSFVWVVRDFSLQLISQTGDPITSLQYLESALAQQKGSSKESTQKNQIRKFITECFPIRECFTLVKPLIHEEKLQALDKVPFEELRPEFVEQVISLRKRVMCKLRPKTLKGVELTGEAYLTTMKCYVEAINNGAVPNIQSAWEYMCIQQNTKRVQDAQEKFENKLKGEIVGRLPCLETELRDILYREREDTLNFLKSKLFGEGQQAIEELKKQIDQKIETVLLNNQKESVSVAQNLISKEYQQINKKLKSGFYTKFAEFESDMKSFYAFMMEKNRRYANCELVYLEFLNKRLGEGSQHFTRLLEQEIEAQRTTRADCQTKYDKDFSDMKSQALREKAHLTEVINRLERERVQMQFTSEQTSKQVKDMADQSSQLEQHYKGKFEHLTKDLESLNKELKMKDQLLQEKRQESERVSFLRDGEWQKQKALNEQQQKFFKDKLEEADRREKQIEQSLTAVRTEWEARFRETQNSTEVRIKNLNAQVTEKTQKISELTDTNNRLKDELKSMEEFSERKEKKLRQDLQNLERALEGYKSTGTLERNRLMVEGINEKKNLLLSLDEEKEKIRTVEIQMKEQADQLKLCRANLEKDKAIYTQKIQFQEIELTELRSKYSELQNKYHDTVNNFENSSRERLDQAQKALIFDLKNTHEQQLKQLEIEQQSKIKQMRTELEITRKKKQDLELQLQIDSKKSQDREMQLRESLQKLEEMSERFQKEKLSSDKGFEEIKRELEGHYSIKMRKLEQELDEMKRCSKAEAADIQSKSEETMKELKNYFQIEKERLDRKILDEKEKGQKRAKKLLQEAEQRFNDEKGQLEDENNCLRDNLTEMQSVTSQKIANMQYEFDVTLQKLNNEILEKKIDFNKQVAVLQQQLDFGNKRVEEITREKDQAAARFEERLKTVKEEIQSEARQHIARVTEEKAVLDSKNQKLKKSLKQAETILNKLNVDFQRQKTTLRERVAVLETRLNQADERARLQKQLLQQQIQKLSESHKLERSGLLRQIERCKEANLQLQQQRQQLITRYENEKVLMTNRAKWNEDQRKRYKDDYEDIMVKFETAVKHLSKEKEVLHNLRNQATNEVALALKSQYEREAEGLRSNHMKIVRDLEDKVQRLQNEKKGLNDKVLGLQVKISGLSSQSNSGENERRLLRELEKSKQEHDVKMAEYQNLLESERRQYKRVVDRLETKVADFDRKRVDNPYENDGSRWNGATITTFKDTTNLNSNSKLVTRESETKKSRLATTSNVGSASNLLSNIGQAPPKRPTKDRLIDIAEFGGIIQFDKSRNKD